MVKPDCPSRRVRAKKLASARRRDKKDRKRLRPADAPLDADGLPRLASHAELFVRIKGCLAVLISSSVSFAAVLARAAPMDPALERLITSTSAGCRNAAGEIVAGSATYNPCEPDNAAFKRLVSQYAFAFAPSAMHSARTTGFGGFHVSLEAMVSTIDSGRDYWKKGTQGDDNSVSAQNSSPPGVLQMYSVKLRKSFGFGLEVAGSFGTMPKTSLWSSGADIRLSLLEGFRKSIPGMIPDIAIGGAVRTITGTPELQLTISSLDAQISKPIPIENAVVVTPWIGYQYLWIFGDSNVVDFTPKTDPFASCGYNGINAPGQTSSTAGAYSGQPLCSSAGQVWDFNNNRIFDPARLRRQRLLLGANLRYETFMFGAQLITDLVSPSNAQSGNASKSALRGENRQYSGVFELGVMF